MINAPYWMIASLGLVGIGVAPVGAQVVVGRVSEAGTGAVVEGAFVALEEEGGTRAQAVLTRADGSFSMRARRGGSYRIRVERIGYASVETAFFSLPRDGRVRQDVRMSTKAIALEGIEVGGERRCDLLAEQGQVTVALWEEARKALTVATWAEESYLQYRARTFRRTVAADGRIEQEASRQRSGWGREIFRSLAADSLEEGGFVQRAGDSYVFYGPDAQVLLSDSFLRTHCFRIVSSQDRVGLQFDPVPGRRMPDVSGTLWFDPDGIELQELEFEYVFLPPELRYEGLGGRVGFLRIPDGAWVIRDWVIRMPRLSEEVAFGGRLVTRVSGTVEAGGVVTDLRPTTPVRISLGRGSVSGRALSADGAGVPDGVVTLYGTNYSGETDGSGYFRIERIPTGDYTAVLDHPLFDSLGFARPEVSVTVSSIAPSDVVLKVPSLEEVAITECADGLANRRVSEPQRGMLRLGHTAILSGWVRSTRDGSRTSGTSVEIRWSELERAGAALFRQGMELRVRTDEFGRYLMCEVPVGLPLEVRAFGQDTEGSWMHVDPLQSDAVERVDLLVTGK